VNATELYRAGHLKESIDALGAEIRGNPTDSRRRTFLFELLCFAGEYDRAEKHLDVLASGGKDASMGALLYRSALHATRLREDQYRSGSAFMAPRPNENVRGTIDGREFSRLVDADPRLGARLEVYAAGQFMWIPFEHIESILMQPPQRLRDLLWIPARLKTGPLFQGMELGEILLPALTAGAWEDEDDNVRLGRTTEWVQTETGDVVPMGQKTLIADDQEYSLLDVREILIAPSATPNS
jgi:type VI secretion system protein ImpE